MPHSIHEPGDPATQASAPVPKRTKSLKSLMHQSETLKRPRCDDRNDHADEASQVCQGTPSHAVSSASNFFKKFHDPPAKSDTNLLTESTKTLCNALATSHESLMRQSHKEIVARIEGIDANGVQTSRHGVPSQADFDRLFEEYNHLDGSLEDDVLEVEFTTVQGDKVFDNVRFGKTWETFRARCERSLPEIAKLEAEQAALRAEIQELKMDLLGRDEAIRAAMEAHEKELEILRSEQHQADEHRSQGLAAITADQKAADAEIFRRLNGTDDTSH